MDDKTTIQVKKKTWKRLMLIKVETNAKDLDEVIYSMISKKNSKDKKT